MKTRQQQVKIQTLMQNMHQRPTTSAEPHFPTKQELDDLIRGLGLTKFGAELLTSRLNEWNLLGNDCKSTAYRKRHLEFSVYFDVIEDLCYCKDIEGLFGINHDPTQWWPFIDSSTKSLKAVLPELGTANLHSIPQTCKRCSATANPQVCVFALPQT